MSTAYSAGFLFCDLWLGTTSQGYSQTIVFSANPEPELLEPRSLATATKIHQNSCDNSNEHTWCVWCFDDAGDRSSKNCVNTLNLLITTVITITAQMRSCTRTAMITTTATSRTAPVVWKATNITDKVEYLRNNDLILLHLEQIGDVVDRKCALLLVCSLNVTRV